MSDEALREIERGEHRVPRWISRLWLALVACMVLTATVMAVRSGGDLAGRLGFLVLTSLVIFVLSAVAYVALYGLSILLEGVDYHKTHCDDSKHFAGMMDFIR
jgi:hypothetical protein